MSRLEEVRETKRIILESEEKLDFVPYRILMDISETLAMIYDKLNEKVEGNDDT